MGRRGVIATSCKQPVSGRAPALILGRVKFSAVRRRRALVCGCLPLLAVAAAALNVPGANGSTARISLGSGGLALLDPSVAVVGHNPTQLDVKADVVDARGTGAGWFLSVAAYATGDSTSFSSRLIVAGANAACLPDSACTLPVNDTPYPATVSLGGTRSMVFEAEPSSGLGAQQVEFRVYPAGAVPPGLSLSFSLGTQPSALAGTFGP